MITFSIIQKSQLEEAKRKVEEMIERGGDN